MAMLRDAAGCCGGSSRSVVAISSAAVTIQEITTAVHPYQRIAQLRRQNNFAGPEAIILKRRPQRNR